MQNLIGRRVEIVSGAMHPDLMGRVTVDRGESVVVVCEENPKYQHYIAKFRLLCNEYCEFDRPEAVGVYLIREPEEE